MAKVSFSTPIEFLSSMYYEYCFFAWCDAHLLKQGSLSLRLVAFQQVMVKWSRATSHSMESYLQVLAMTRRQGCLWSLSFLITGRILIGVRKCECIFFAGSSLEYGYI